MPLALVTGGNLYFIHPDHLNTPQKATDASQNLAWDAVLRPFGQTEQQTFPSLTNLRFPGQYFDVEDGLHQNWFRDYDSSIGRYVESDPIGLAGGLNTYAYVRANPISHRDITGRQTREDVIICLAYPKLCSIPELKVCRIDPATSPYLHSKPPVPPLPDFDFNDPKKPPVNPNGKQWDWHGPDDPGGRRGGWVNPDNPDQSIHPDLDHGPPYGPHWDYNDEVPGDGWRIGPDGSVTSKS
jgi:RHS repeat-associated protein